MSGTGSSIVDEDTARAVNSGRETIGAMLSTAQDHLRKVFIVFLIGFLGCFYALRGVGWPYLKDVTTAQMSPDIAESITIVAVTPFDVILLQAKIGVVAGVLVALPVLLYYARHEFRNKHWYPDAPIARWKIAVLVALALGLFVGGVIYGYAVFFPLMFQFLADNALTAGFQTNYSIVKWTEFILFLSLSFGLAAELPLAMSGLGYTGIVPYETFRDKWRYAIMGIFVFGALASPPDPFTQLMWATPLILLYAFSLYLTKVVVTLKRAGERVSVAGVLRDDWIRIAGAPVLAFLAVRMVLTGGAREAVNGSLPAAYRLPPVESVVGLPRGQSVLAVAAGAAVLTLVVAVAYYVLRALNEIGTGPEPGRGRSPGDIDLDGLDAGGVRAAPPQVFEEMSEAEAVDHARQAMDDDDGEKAQVILDRWDEFNPDEDEDAEAAEADEGEDDADTEEATFPREPERSDNPVQSTAAGMADAFTDEETTEEDIGGWYYDIRFILDSLTSKMFWLVGIFMAVLASVFTFLYMGGIGDIREDFLRRLPAEVRPEPGSGEEILDIVVLHPVEALIFEVKISTLLAGVAVLPVLLYWAWPAMKERGLAAGDRRVFGVWGGTIALGLLGGSALGYAFVAPSVISWLVADAVRAEMIISYRVSNFFWLVFFTTAGIGLLADVPLTMWLFHWGDILSFETMKNKWREVTIAIFAAAGLLTPDSLYTMFLIAIPLSAAYLFGLGTLWVVTLGGRR
ncbi:twin-arginine translocase subunit TatC [Halorussus salilacus]|uniref:twin-arginine translocase subunit TatC n=1 Tax=Halorussus salilacus TaxID=2953750 RepID=UPI00209D4C9C|nr:twin-arginine translocase subunit TatC [Halorussus salilacus]USZ69568.1 twin-arginine translocase subunit TatC [Halorussus salilacus]